MPRASLGLGPWAAINWGNSASVSGLSDENVEIFLETFLQFHPANRSPAAAALSRARVGALATARGPKHAVENTGCDKFRITFFAKLKAILLC
jgi:hypothetical protein